MRRFELFEISPEISDRIKICRVLGIFFVVLVHLQPRSNVIEGAPRVIEAARYFFINILGHASVPLLSVISGYLLVSAMRSKTWGAYVRHRFQVLCVPMLVWNVIFAATISALYFLGFETGVWRWMLDAGPVSSILAVTSRPINGPLYFLRDMFVISIFAPLLIRAIRRAPWAVMLASGILVALDIGPPVIFRPLTLFCSCLGILLYVRQTDLHRLDRWLLPVLAISAAFWITGMFWVFSRGADINPFLSEGWFDLANRFVVIIVFWLVSGAVARSAVLPGFLRLERFIYLVFLSHTVTLFFISGAFYMAFNGYNTPFYLLLMAAAPFLCLLAAWLMLPTLRRLPAWAQRAITGRALPAPPAFAPVRQL
jgi:surface polysaccharide O-acyltransferase-like enzyme